MAEDRSKMLAIKDQVQEGNYKVDSHLVADAIIRRMQGIGGVSLLLGAQNSCSNPARSSSVSRNTAPGSPATTDPIQVSPSFAPKHC